MKFWSNSEIPQFVSQIPEKRLLAAVLQRAITDFLTGDGDLRDSAEGWLINNEPEDAPLTFDFICEALDLDPHGLQKALVAQAQMAQTAALQAAG